MFKVNYSGAKNDCVYESAHDTAKQAREAAKLLQSYGYIKVKVTRMTEEEVKAYFYEEPSQEDWQEEREDAHTEEMYYRGSRQSWRDNESFDYHQREDSWMDRD